jgi:hypothetical protein
MKKLILGVVAGAALTVGAVLAWATPPSGIAGGPIVARGTAAQPFVLGTAQTTTVTRRVRVRVRGKTYVRRVRVSVPTVRPVISCGGGTTCDSAVQQVTINPGGTTGWHTHPGATFVAVAQGEGVLYHAGTSSCPSERYAAGTGFYQTERDVHTFRNEGTSPLVIYAFYVLPPGTANTAIRVDQPQPTGCPNINYAKRRGQVLRRQRRRI